MARKMSARDPEPQGVKITSESGKAIASNRKAAIVDACRQISSLKAERAEITAQISEIYSKVVKGDLEMKRTDFGIILRAYELEGDDRNQFLDTLREGFEALGIGEQLNFLDAMEDETELDPDGEDDGGEPQATDEPRDLKDMAKQPRAYQAGYAAGQSGHGVDTNPHHMANKPRLHKMWVDGWGDGQADLVRSFGQKAQADATLQ